MQKYSNFLDDEEEQTMVTTVLDNNARTTSLIALASINQNPVRQGRGGSVNERRIVPVDRGDMNQRLVNHYFADIFDATVRPRFSEETFRRRYRMHRNLFIKISSDLENQYKYFKQLPDATGLLGYSTWIKTTTALRLLAYGVSGDILQESIGLAASTSKECLMKFCVGIRKLYGQEYLRVPTKEDLKRIMAINKQRGFPGMIGSIDCMHWEWKNCPTAWAGMFTGKEKKPTLILEAVATQDLWIWHSFFGLPGSLNDINVIDRSPVFDALLGEKIPDTPYTVNGKVYDKPYYLGDGIYPQIATIVKACKDITNARQKLFSTKQESVRKDIERCFGVLQTRFAIICQPARMWHLKELKTVMTACIILHNMIIQDERDEDSVVEYVRREPNDSNSQNQPDPAIRQEYSEFLKRYFQIHCKQTSHQLQKDLIDHQWHMEGNSSA